MMELIKLDDLRMKKVKRLGRNSISEVSQTCSSSLSPSESIVSLNGIKEGTLRVESNLLERTHGASFNQTKSKIQTTALKPITLTVYLLSSLFLFQLVLTTIGFYIQFNYIKSQNELFESRISSFFDRVTADLNSDFNQLLEQVAKRKNPASDDANFMILNLTHAINLDDLNADELNRTVLAYRRNLFEAVMNEKINSRIKRDTKPPSSFYYKVKFNQSNNRTHRHQSDTFFLSDQQPRNVSGEHFLIQAYSKISVIKLFLMVKLVENDKGCKLRYLHWRNIVLRPENIVRRRLLVL